VAENAFCSKINENTAHMNYTFKCTTVLCIHTHIHTAVFAIPVTDLNQVTYQCHDSGF
jgi:hypothetical protein